MAKPHLQCPVEKEAARELEEELEEAGETVKGQQRHLSLVRDQRDSFRQEFEMTETILRA